MPTSAELELLEATQKLLKSIDQGDWNTYTELCDEEITCFEPEAEGHLVSGLPFHQFYFDLPAGKLPKLSSASSPNIRVIGQVGIVCYTRLVQTLDANGSPITKASNETRIWRRQGDSWKHIHFHRSPC